MLFSLIRPIDDVEIRNILFSMKPLKALGIDGLHAIFYQSQWSIVGPSICRFVTEIFSSGTIPPNINKTLLVLIPKTDNPRNLSMYRPMNSYPQDCDKAYR